MLFTLYCRAPRPLHGQAVAPCRAQEVHGRLPWGDLRSGAERSRLKGHFRTDGEFKRSCMTAGRFCAIALHFTNVSYLAVHQDNIIIHRPFHVCSLHWGKAQSQLCQAPGWLLVSRGRFRAVEAPLRTDEGVTDRRQHFLPMPVPPLYPPTCSSPRFSRLPAAGMRTNRQTPRPSSSA